MKLLFVRGFVFAVLATVSDAVAVDNWHEDAFFGLHYDFHAQATDTELGRLTTYDHIKAMLEKVRPDFVQYDCKGHAGYTSYPTKVGSPSPGIVNDALMIWRQVTRDLGIPLSIHYSGIWDTRAIELHPDYARIDHEGNPDDRKICLMSRYDTDLMIPQLREVVHNYDVDGMWIDGENWATRPCWCERCREEFTLRTDIIEIPINPDDAEWHPWLSFHRDLFTEHVSRFVTAVHEVKPTCMVTSNWMYSVRQPEAMVAPIDYISGDFSPSFGAERACAEARFIDGRGKPWDLMAWGFLRTGDEGWTMKTVPHLSQEVAVVLAQGGSVFIYNQPQRSGALTAWHQDMFGQVADFCRKRQEYSFRTETVPQVVILHSENSYYHYNKPLFNFGDANESMEGALHALLESGYSVDLRNEVDLTEQLDRYPVVVVPEMAHVSETCRAALRDYVEAGGRLLLSGAHVAEQFGELAGVSLRDGELEGGWLPVGNEAVTVGGVYQPTTLNGAELLANVLEEQDPESNQRDLAAATRHEFGRGVVVAVHGPVFRSYHRSHYPRLRRFIGNMMEALDAKNLIRLHGPWYIEMSARQKDGKQLIQFVNRGSSGYTAPNRHIVEHVSDTGGFTVSIPMDGAPHRCYMAPDEVGLEWSWNDNLLTARISGLAIHNVLVVE